MNKRKTERCGGTVPQSQQNIVAIRFQQMQINAVDQRIKEVIMELRSPILSVSSVSYTLGEIILAELGDISRSPSPEKLLAFAGLEPSTYQSDKFLPILHLW